MTRNGGPGSKVAALSDPSSLSKATRPFFILSVKCRRVFRLGNEAPSFKTGYKGSEYSTSL